VIFGRVALVSLALACLTVVPMTMLASPVVVHGADVPAGSTPSPATPAGHPVARSGGIVLDFEHADIGMLIQAVSEIVGFRYVLAPDVRGTVTVQTSGAIRREDVLPIFLSILQVHGFTAVKAGDVYRIVRTGPRPGPTSPPDAGPSPGAAMEPDRLVTQVLVLRFASVATLATVVRHLVSSRGSVVADPVANVLIVTDTAVNVGKVAEIVTRIDTALAPEELNVIQLQYADARDMAAILNDLFAGERLVRPPVIVADPRTNSLVIRARPSELKAIGRLLGHE
jgi:general secretion pathway protein D